jgi:phosphonate transport system substrate-binding protein
MMRNDVPATVHAQVRELLLGLDGTKEGKLILEGMEMGRFLPASDEDYAVVRRYVARFEREVRPVEKR